MLPLSFSVTFLSTLSLRRATAECQGYFHLLAISIHALLAESDMSLFCHCWNSFGISIHALLAESDACYSPALPERYNFYPRSPCGERQKSFRSLDTGQIFLSTLSLRRATRGWTLNINGPLFLSTLSLRRATNSAYGALDGASISIHALLAESDQPKKKSTRQVKHFYPRSPCGERLAYSWLFAWIAYFYPRSPCGERPYYKENTLSTK